MGFPVGQDQEDYTRYLSNDYVKDLRNIIAHLLNRRVLGCHIHYWYQQERDARLAGNLGRNTS